VKKLLTKFRLSNALDENPGQPLPDSLRKIIGACPDLRKFAQRAAELDRALGRPPGVPTPDEALHRSIMRAVLGATEPAPTSVPIRIGLVAALTALAAIGIWLAIRSPSPGLSASPSEAQRKEAAQIVMDIGGQISHSVPLAVVAPLSNEWASVDHDVRDTTRFILASLP
jgi:hypothetical protein